jgi:hypothetical protein
MPFPAQRMLAGEDVLQIRYGVLYECAPVSGAQLALEEPARAPPDKRVIHPPRLLQLDRGQYLTETTHPRRGRRGQ